MLYLRFAPTEKNKCWTVLEEGKPIARVTIKGDGRCMLDAPKPLDLDALESCLMFMREVAPQS